MEWRKIRDAFRATREARRINQDQVAGMSQAMISKLETNENLGPTVETFVNAVQGLGMSVSEFFAQIEDAGADRSTRTGPQPHLSPSERELIDLWRNAVKLPPGTKEHIRGMLLGAQAPKKQHRHSA